eukprot:TRINITY_DN749_c2_g1_i2.p1 TRINITY_DN749_c2_g1~~TRINITY_DN749_c2_g1_i2.p1  ORF type:complete len:683 (+),score=148.80 TRINITY_DN749_c2_g1_i2:384-2432(+)
MLQRICNCCVFVLVLTLIPCFVCQTLTGVLVTPLPETPAQSQFISAIFGIQGDTSPPPPPPEVSAFDVIDTVAIQEEELDPVAETTTTTVPPPTTTPAAAAPTGGFVAPPAFGFLHGVASGDPTATSVIIWTRWTPPQGQDLTLLEQSVQYQVSTDALFEDVVDFGVVVTDIEKDFTVKKVVKGLNEGTTYYYKFISSGRETRTGKTRTLPSSNVEQLRFAVVSGANWRRGFFNAYSAAAKVKDLDFLLNLGDFIFESDDQTNPNPSEYNLVGRAELQPSTEVATLGEYRIRHALYRTDEGLLELLANVPMFSSWDDHEIVAGAYKSGAASHDISKGPYELRKQFAMQAYQEWMPIQSFQRDMGDTYREFYFGDLAVLVLPETRLTQRDAPINILSSELGQQIESVSAANWTTVVTAEAINQLKAEINAPDRVMIGEQQMGNIEYTARLPGATWYLLGSQTSVGQTACADFEDALNVLAAATRPSYQLLLDAIEDETVENEILRNCFASGVFGLPQDAEAWSGYPVERQKLISALNQRNIAENGRSVILSGNSFDSAVGKIFDNASNPVSVEFQVPSVTEPGFEFIDQIANEIIPDLSWENWFVGAKQLANPGLIYYNLGERGFAVVTVKMEELHVDYVYVTTVQTTEFDFQCRAAFDVSLDAPGDVDLGRCTRDFDLFIEQ